MASPYQIAGTRASLADLLQQSNLQQQQSQRAGSKQMGEMQEKFEDELEKLQSDARKRSKKNKGLGSLLNIAALGLGPLGAGIAKGLSSSLQLQDQKTGAKMLLNKDMQKRYGNTFLRGGMKNFTEMAKDAQVSSGDVLRGAFGSGLAGFGMSKMLGGSKEDGGLFKKMFKKPEDILETGADVSNIGIKAPDFASDLLENTTSKANEMWQGAVDTGESSFGIGGAKVQAPDLLSGNNIQGLGSSMELKRDLISNPIGKMISGGQATPMKTLLELFKGFSKGEGFKGGMKGMEGMQNATMLPILLQQLFGGE